MKAVKILGIILLVLAIGFGLTLWYGLRNIDTLVQTAVERFGSDVTNTAVELQSVDIQLQEGRAQLSDLTIANPEGYSSEYAFALDDIIVQIDRRSLGTGAEDVIVIEEITVDGASIIAELQGLQNSNLQELAKNVQRKIPAEQDTAPPEPPSEYVGPNLRVMTFQFSNASIQVISDQFGERTLDMPTVTAADLGGANGLPPRDLASALLEQVLAQAIATVKKEVGDTAKQEVRSRVQERIQENLSEEEQEKVRGLRDILNR